MSESSLKIIRPPGESSGDLHKLSSRAELIFPSHPSLPKLFLENDSPLGDLVEVPRSLIADGSPQHPPRNSQAPSARFLGEIDPASSAGLVVRSNEARARLSNGARANLKQPG